MTLSELEKRLQLATGADRELDGLILWHMTAEDHRRIRDGVYEIKHDHFVGPQGPHYYEAASYVDDPDGYDHSVNGFIAGLRFTASLDAALALVERKLPGWGLLCDTFPPNQPYASVSFEDKVFGATGATRPIAMLLALVSALQQTETENAVR